MKIATILGARPQFIKAGSVSREVLRQKLVGATLYATGISSFADVPWSYGVEQSDYASAMPFVEFMKRLIDED